MGPVGGCIKFRCQASPGGQPPHHHQEHKGRPDSTLNLQTGDLCSQWMALWSPGCWRRGATEPGGGKPRRGCPTWKIPLLLPSFPLSLDFGFSAQNQANLPNKSQPCGPHPISQAFIERVTSFQFTSSFQKYFTMFQLPQVTCTLSISPLSKQADYQCANPTHLLPLHLAALLHGCGRTGQSLELFRPLS